MAKKIIYEASRTLMEFRLLPGLTTNKTTISEISLKTPLVYSENLERKYFLNIPLVSAAMQSVSGAEMGIALAKCGGTAVIYCSQPIESQAEMIRTIKKYKAGFVKPSTVNPEMLIKELYKVRKETGYSTFPVVDENSNFLGLVSKYDYDISLHSECSIAERMISKENIDVGVNIQSLKEANRILLESHKSVLPILDGEGKLLYLVFRKDIHDHIENPLEIVDEKKRLLAVAAINTMDFKSRVPALVDAEVDILVIDSSDGHTYFQKETLKWIGLNYPEIPVIAGNVITKSGFRVLVKAGAKAVN